jgi:hypothetical protein
MVHQGKRILRAILKFYLAHRGNNSLENWDARYRNSLLVCQLLLMKNDLSQAYDYNPNTQKAEAGELRVLGQPGVHSKILSQKNFFKKEGRKRWWEGGKEKLSKAVFQKLFIHWGCG